MGKSYLKWIQPHECECVNRYALDVAEPIFGAPIYSSLMHCSQNMMGLHPCHCTSQIKATTTTAVHTSAMLLHSSDATAIMSTRIATAETVRIAAPYHPNLSLPPPSQQMSWEATTALSWAQKNKERSYVEFCHFMFHPPNASHVSPFYFSIKVLHPDELD